MEMKPKCQKKFMNKNKLTIAFILLFFLLFSFQPAKSEENSNLTNKRKSFTIAPADALNTFSAELSGQFKLSVIPELLNSTTTLVLTEISDLITVPWQLKQVSKIFQYDFTNPDALNKKPIYLHLKCAVNNKYLNQVYFYDNNKKAWRPLPTRITNTNTAVVATTNLSFSKIAVFSNPRILAAGKASWYKYKGGDFAASPDFPKGSRIRVHIISPYKNKFPFIDVTINDYGPNREISPDLVIDLDKLAFNKIAPLGAGKINIRIEPLYVSNDKIGRKIYSDLSARDKPQISSKSAILMNEDTNEILYEKNATSTLPLASLTKLAAIKVFLDTKPTLSTVVSYSINDENFNYKYVDYKWQAATLKVKNGDKLTIADLLYSALVGSANNAVETLVRVSGLNRNDFISNMNNLVKSWGASSTKFVEPTGLSPNNVSSVKDYAIITKEVYKHPIIKKASLMAEYAFTTINTKKKHRLYNTNYLISSGSNLKITGSKTGYLDEAGYCLMSRAENKNKENLIAVVFGSKTKEGSIIETEDLLYYGLKLSNNYD